MSKIVNLYHIPDRQCWARKKGNTYIGRGTPELPPSKWGNPYKVGIYTREEAISLYEDYLLANATLKSSLSELIGEVLGCWCVPEPCHGEVLSRLSHSVQGLPTTYSSQGEAMDMKTNDMNEYEDGVCTSHTTSTSVTSTLVILPTNTVTTVTSSANVVPSIVPIMLESYKKQTRKSDPMITRSKSGAKINSSVKIHISPEPSEAITRVKLSPKEPSSPISPTDSPTPTNSPSSNTACYSGGINFDTPKDISPEVLYKMIVERDTRMDNLHGRVDMIESLLHVKDCVIDGLKNEIQRLQQYTRRYSVNISGIPKPRKEEKGDLQKIVEELITEVNSTTTVADIDKLHRNGPAKGDQQDVIMRFKSHSSKEARKKLGQNRGIKGIKIRPSLSPAQKELLIDSCDYQATLDNADLHNPPEFVFANVHNDIQVKMKQKCKDGLFVSFNHIDHLTRVISRANMDEESFKVFDTDSSWADGGKNDSSDDDMGFGLYD